jgi:hypothetical protein
MPSDGNEHMVVNDRVSRLALIEWEQRGFWADSTHGWIRVRFRGVATKMELETPAVEDGPTLPWDRNMVGMDGWKLFIYSFHPSTKRFEASNVM